jgi:hypothetical protein
MRKFHTLKKEIQEFSHRVTELTEFLTIIQVLMELMESFPQENLVGQMKMFFIHGNKFDFRELDFRVEKTFVIPFS